MCGWLVDQQISSCRCQSYFMTLKAHAPSVVFICIYTQYLYSYSHEYQKIHLWTNADAKTADCEAKHGKPGKEWKNLLLFQGSPVLFTYLISSRDLTSRETRILHGRHERQVAISLEASLDWEWRRNRCEHGSQDVLLDNAYSAVLSSGIELGAFLNSANNFDNLPFNRNVEQFAVV